MATAPVATAAADGRGATGSSRPLSCLLWLPHLLWLLGAVLVLLTASGTLLHRPDEGEIGTWARLYGWVGLTLLAGCAYLAACWLVLRPPPSAVAGAPARAGPGRAAMPPSLSLVLLVAAAMRVVPLLAPPFLSSDVYRYVWDGRVQMAGVNPYVHVPEDEALAHLRDPAPWPYGVFSNINRRATARTIYPPVAQGLFLLNAATWPGVLAMKLLMVLLEAVAVGVAAWLLRLAGQPPTRVLLYAWAPLPAWEFAGNGHIDGASLGFLALALLAAAYRSGTTAGLMLGAATLCKFLPIAVLPALWRPFAALGRSQAKCARFAVENAPDKQLGRVHARREHGLAPAGPAAPPADPGQGGRLRRVVRRFQPRLPLALGALIVAGYACYLGGAGWGVLGFLPGYGEEEGLGSGAGILWMRLLALVAPVVPGWVGKAYLAAALAALGLLALAISRTPLPDAPGARGIALARGALLLAGALMAAVTPHYAWYLCWLPWLACLYPLPSILLLTTLAPLLYLDGDHDRVLWPTLVFLPAVLVAALRDLRKASPA